MPSMETNELDYGEYVIEIHKYGYTLHKMLVKGEDSENAGEVYRVPIGHYPSLAVLVTRLIDTKLINEDIKTFKDILIKLDKIHEDVINIAKEDKKRQLMRKK